MAQLTVVTHTRGDRPELLRQCCASVEAQLPSGAQHIVIQVDSQGDPNVLMKARLDALALGDIVAFVDDDDYLINDVLTLAYDAIVAHNAGLCFTGERLVDFLGTPIRDSDVNGPKFLSMLAIHPNIAHHLCLIRSSSVSPSCWSKIDDYGPALEWMIKGSAGLSTESTVFVPQIGYCWRQHPNSLSKSRSWPDLYSPDLFSKVSNDLRSMLVSDKRIPAYTGSFTLPIKQTHRSEL